MDERDIGANIRRQREAAGLTLTALAQRAELTKSSLSKIETGQSSAPISTVLLHRGRPGCAACGIFVAPAEEPAYVLTRHGQGRIITRDGSRFGYSYEALALAMRHKHAEPFVLTIRPGDPVGRFRHGGEEFIYMLAGQLAMTIGEDELMLHPGDSLYFDPTHEHTTRVLGKTPAKFLCLFVQDTPTRPSHPTHGRPTRPGRPCKPFDETPQAADHHLQERDMIGIDLSGKTAVVTGASQGIGAMTARRLHQAGANIAINYFEEGQGINRGNAQRLADELGERNRAGCGRASGGAGAGDAG